MTALSERSSMSLRMPQPPRHCPAPPVSGMSSKRCTRTGLMVSCTSTGMLEQFMTGLSASAPSLPSRPP